MAQILDKAAFFIGAFGSQMVWVMLIDVLFRMTMLRACISSPGLPYELPQTPWLRKQKVVFRVLEAGSTDQGASRPRLSGNSRGETPLVALLQLLVALAVPWFVPASTFTWFSLHVYPPVCLL